MQEIVKLESSAAEDFGKHLYYLDLMRKNPQEYCKRQKEYEEKISKLPAPSLNWDENKASSDRFYEITTNPPTNAPLFIGCTKDEFKTHLLGGLLWRSPLILSGQLNILAGVIHKIARKGIINVGHKIFKITSPHFATPSNEPITAKDLSKALNQGFGIKAAETVKNIVLYIS